jgi:hypothetical protein
MALSVSILPMLFFYPTLITAPLTLFITYRYWNAPLSVGHHTKIRFVVASILALLQILLWVLVFVFLAQLFYA